MGRVSAEERIRKETALEALEALLKREGREKRPKAAHKGFAAVQQAIVWWKGVGSWGDLSGEEQEQALATHTAWRMYRKKRPGGGMAREVDAQRLAEYGPILERLLYLDVETEDGGGGTEAVEFRGEGKGRHELKVSASARSRPKATAS